MGQDEQRNILRFSAQFFEVIKYYCRCVLHAAVNNADFSAHDKINIDKALKGFSRSHRNLEGNLQGVDTVCYLHSNSPEILTRQYLLPA